MISIITLKPKHQFPSALVYKLLYGTYLDSCGIEEMPKLCCIEDYEPG